MHDPKSQNLLERIEVVVAVQELMIAFETEGRDPAVDCLIHRVATLSEGPVVLRGGDGQIDTAAWEDLEL